MRWHLSDEQLAYQQALRSWLGSVAPSETLRGWLDSGANGHRAFGRRFVEDGFAGVGFAEEVGGQGGGLVELALTAEELAYAGVPSSQWLAAAIAAPLLTRRPDLIEASINGTLTALLVPAEVIPSFACVASADGGRVPRVLAGDLASSFLVVDGEALRLVPGSAASVAERKLLDRSRSVADVTVPPGVGEPIEVDHPLPELLDRVAARAAVLVAADALGASQRMLDMTVAYSLQRRQFGVPIGSFQAVKHAAATMLVGVEAARSAVYYAAASVDLATAESFRHAAAVKLQITAEAARAADTALSLHGAIGYTWEHDLHLFYKRAKLDESLFGSPGSWADVLAHSLSLVPTS
jgi:alkylation response protein AidB-like acyl-CoA dehydrogenase